MKYLLPLIFLLLAACQSGESAPTANTPPLPTSLPADFISFYEQFHADSAYQMAHIQWPLPGIPSNDSLRVPGFTFQTESWKLHRQFDPETSGYTSSFQPLTEDMIIERISDDQNRYGLERRWLRNSQSDEWELIYYQQPMPLGN
ncbi:MAG: hypothetical protein AAF433_06350 [Bacteroidota bacterium]